MSKLKWKKDGYQQYKTACGRFVAGSCTSLGSSRSWYLQDNEEEDPKRRVRSRATLRACKDAAADIVEAEAAEAATPDMSKYDRDLAPLLAEAGITEIKVSVDELRELCAAYQDMQRIKNAQDRLRKHRLQAIMDIDMLADACDLDVSEYPD